jgi:arylsulfatase A-like enzyme
MAKVLATTVSFTHGVFLYDSTMHIPLMVAGPGVPSGKVITKQVRSIDVMPTIADYLGLSPGNQAQGVSLLPAVLEGRALPAKFAYMETLYPKTALGWAELRAVRTEEWKYVAAPKPELYHLSEDPAEARSVNESQKDQPRSWRSTSGKWLGPVRAWETGAQPGERRHDAPASVAGLCQRGDAPRLAN